MVRPLPERRVRGAERQTPQAEAGLEPYPGRCSGAGLRLDLDAPELSPRELATRFIDTEGYFVSEASVCRLLKAHDLITSPAFVVIKAADEFRDKTTAPNQLWQTDFTYLKVIGWGRFYLSTILDDFSRYIIAWKLCTAMRTEDVTDTLELELKASGCDQAKGVHKPRLLSDNGSSYISGDLAECSMIRAWSMSAAHLAIPRPRARSSAGCPSSKQMGLLSVFHREDLAHLRLMLSRLALMVQAAVLGGQFLIFFLFSMMAVWRPK